jgi:FkbM family methyltransferase
MPARHRSRRTKPRRVSARRTRGGGDPYRYSDEFEYDIPSSGGPHSSTPYEYSHDAFHRGSDYSTYNAPYSTAVPPAAVEPFGDALSPWDYTGAVDDAALHTDTDAPFGDAEPIESHTDDGVLDEDFYTGDVDGVETHPDMDLGEDLYTGDVDGVETHPDMDLGEDLYTGDVDGVETHPDIDLGEDLYTGDVDGVETHPDAGLGDIEFDEHGVDAEHTSSDDGYADFGDPIVAEPANHDTESSYHDDYAGIGDFDADYGAVDADYGDDFKENDYGAIDTDDDDDYKENDTNYGDYGTVAAAGLGAAGLGAATLAASSLRTETPIVDSVRDGISTVGDKLHRASARWKQVHGLRDAKDYLRDAKDYVADKIQRFREKMSGGGDGGAREPNDVAPIGKYLNPWREQLPLVRWRDRRTIKQPISGRKTRKAATTAAAAKERKTFVNEHGKRIPFETYEQFEQYLVQKWIKPTDIVLELGARCGVVSCTINSILAEKSAHVAVEPDPEALVALRKNKATFGGKFRVCGAAIGDTPLTMLADDEGLGNYTVAAAGAEVPPGLHSFSVKNIPRDEFFKKYALPFTALVMDCEGCAGRFLADNFHRFEDLEMVLFERDNVAMCDYDAMTKQLEGAGFTKADDLLDGFQQVWLRSRGGPAL